MSEPGAMDPDPVAALRAKIRAGFDAARAQYGDAVPPRHVRDPILDDLERLVTMRTEPKRRPRMPKTPAEDPTLAALREHRAAVEHDEAARLQAVQERPHVREALAVARPALVAIEAFRAEHGPMLRARREELHKPGHVRLTTLAPLRQRLLDEIDAIESLFSNAAWIRSAEDRLAALTLEEAQPSGVDAPFRGSIVATMVRRLWDGSQAPRALEEQWHAHELTWADLAQRLAATAPVLAPGNSQALVPDIEAPAPSTVRYAKSSIGSGGAR